MIHRNFIRIANRQTGEIDGYLTSNDPGPVRGSYDYVELDTTHQDKMTPDLPTKYVYINGQLEALPPKQFEYQVMDYAQRQWVNPPDEAQWARMRSERNRLLLDSDWTDTASAPARLGQARHQPWLTYRQALRDVTLQPDPFSIVWPTTPG
jgi:Phage tail assembly chaperone protein